MGQIVDSGTHAELITRPGVYHDLYTEQFKTVGDLTASPDDPSVSPSSSDLDQLPMPLPL
jgi:hypothetical protein